MSIVSGSQNREVRMKIQTLFLVVPLAACLLASPARAGKDEPSSPRQIRADKEKATLELTILKKELEELRIERVRHVKDIEFKRIYMDSLKNKSLRQRELQEELDVLKDQLTALDKMIDEAGKKLDDALLKAAEAPESPQSPSPVTN
jgi:hypothetical protein